jgi:PDDEXK-like domain of unknown function (DUF3799)
VTAPRQEPGALERGMTARLLKCTPAEYHADPCKVASLSSSIAKIIVTKSPAHAYVEHPKFGGLAKASTRAQDDGSIIHKLVLGRGAELDVLNYADFRTKAAREARDNAIACGRIPITVAKFAPLEEAASIIKERAEDLLKFKFAPECSEIAIEFESEGAEGPVVCRSMLDSLRRENGRATIYDFKKIVSADPRTRSRHAYEYGYDIARAAYTEAVEKLDPELAGRVDFIFIFCELEPPYAVVPCRMTGEFEQLGRSRWQRGVEVWERCLSTGYFPSYCEGIDYLEPPPWAMHDEMGSL